MNYTQNEKILQITNETGSRQLFVGYFNSVHPFGFLLLRDISVLKAS